MKHVVSLALLSLVACKTAAPPPPAARPAGPARASLWSFAPPSPDLGLVVEEGALGDLLAGYDMVMASLAGADPDGAAALRALIDRQPLAQAMLSRATLDDAGIDIAGGAAMFVAAGRFTLVLPVRDRARFRARVGASIGVVDGEEADHIGAYFCRELRGRYLCAMDAVAFSAPQRAPAPWPAELRGEIQMVMSATFAAESQKDTTTPPGWPTLANLRGARAAVELERGAVTIRVHVDATVDAPPPTPWAARAGIVARRPGFFIHMLGRFFAPANAPLIAAGVGPMEELAAWVDAGEALAAGARMRFADAAAARRAVAWCGREGRSAGMTLRGDGSCAGELTLPQQRVQLRVAAEGSDVALLVGAPAAARRGGAHFLTEDDRRPSGYTFWTRGLLAEVFAGLAPPSGRLRFDGKGQATLAWIASHVTELGLRLGWDAGGAHGVLRVATTFQNPDDVQAALEPLLYRAMRGDGAARDEIRALASRHPGSALAGDVAAGSATMRLARLVANAMLARR